MKILFLDFDGVLNSEPYLHGLPPLSQREPYDDLDPELVRRVALFVEAHDLRVVLSTAWAESFGVGQLAAWLHMRGGLDPARVLGMTPRDIPIPRGGHWCPRGDQIRAWLDRHPDVTAFVALDDWPEEDFEAIAGNLVQTDDRVGVTDNDLGRAADVLARTQRVPDSQSETATRNGRG